MRKLILVIRILLIATFANAQQSNNNNFGLHVGPTFNSDFGLGFNTGLDLKLKSGIIFKSQFVAISNETKTAPKNMKNEKPKDKFNAMSFSAGYSILSKSNSVFNFNILAGISKVNTAKHSNFTLLPSYDLSYTNNLILDLFVILPYNLLTNTDNKFDYDTVKKDKVVFTFSPELDFRFGKHSGIALNTNTYFMQDETINEFNLIYKFTF